MSDQGKLHCLSCWAELNEDTKDTKGAVSISGNDLEVCQACWDKISPFERLILNRLYNHYDETSFAHSLYNISQILPKLFEAWHGHSYMDSCGECDRRKTERRESGKQ